MGTTSVERAKRHELIRALLSERDREGLTLAELARRSGIPVGTLAGWTTRIRRKRQAAEVEAPARRSVEFIEVVPRVGTGQHGDARFEVVLRGERRVVVGPTFDEPALVRLVRVLEAC